MAEDMTWGKDLKVGQRVDSITFVTYLINYIHQYVQSASQSFKSLFALIWWLTITGIPRAGQNKFYRSLNSLDNLLTIRKLDSWLWGQRGGLCYCSGSGSWKT